MVYKFSRSQSFSGVQTDVRMDVTDIVKGWLSGSRPNDGFMIKGLMQMNLQIKNMVGYHFSQKIQILYFHQSWSLHGMTQVSQLKFIRITSRR